MSKFFQAVLSLLAFLGLGFVLAKKEQVQPLDKDTEEKLKKAKAVANESNLSDLVSKSNDKFGSGTEPKDS